MTTQPLWTILKLVAILGWFFGIVGGAFLSYGPGRVVLLILIIVHPLELPIALYLAKRDGYPPGAAALQTLLYGFLFWLPEFVLDPPADGAKKR